MRALLTAFGLLLVACFEKPFPRLPLMIQYFAPRELVEHSDIIIVAKVEGIDFKERRRLDDGFWIAPWRVQVDVESTLKGIAKGRVTYFLNNYAPGLLQNGTLERLSKGEVRIIFLVYQGSILRSASDLSATSILLDGPVRLITTRERGAASLPERIATLLLTTPSGGDLRRYAANLPHSTGRALQFAGYRFVASLLANLENSESADIREQACLALFEQLYASDACFRKMEARGVTDQVSRRIETARNQRKYLDARVNEALNAGRGCLLPGAYATGVDNRDPQSISAFLEFLNGTSDPILRHCAEHELAKSRAQ